MPASKTVSAGLKAGDTAPDFEEILPALRRVLFVLDI